MTEETKKELEETVESQQKWLKSIIAHGFTMGYYAGAKEVREETIKKLEAK